MSSCPKLSYTKVSAAAFACLVAKAAEYKVTISGNSGSITAHGFTFKWNYDPAAKTLTVQCTDKSFLVPCSAINGTLDATIKACVKAKP